MIALRQTTASRRLWRLSTTMALGLSLAACGGSPPEERLQQAADKLADTTTSLESVTDEIQRLEDELDNLRKRRSDLVARQMTLEERVAARATDVALFRAVQIELLRLEVLQNVAISVSVENRRVTLRGNVGTQAQHDAAVAAASSAPGVVAVKSRILVAPADRAGAAAGA